MERRSLEPNQLPDIPWLHIPVHDIHRVERGEPRGDLREDVGGNRRREHPGRPQPAPEIRKGTEVEVPMFGLTQSI